MRLDSRDVYVSAGIDDAEIHARVAAQAVRIPNDRRAVVVAPDDRQSRWLECLRVAQCLHACLSVARQETGAPKSAVSCVNRRDGSGAVHALVRDNLDAPSRDVDHARGADSCRRHRNRDHDHGPGSRRGPRHRE
jgi:hypothetical protein